MKRSYEIMTIVGAGLGEQKATQISKDIQKTITSHDGEVVKTDYWGKRRFSYEIKHQTEGFYDLIHFKIDPLKIGQLKNKLNLVQDLLRYLITAQTAEEGK